MEDLQEAEDGEFKFEEATHSLTDQEHYEKNSGESPRGNKTLNQENYQCRFCGIRFQQLEKCISIKLFAFLLMLLIICHSIQYSYLIGVLSTIEKRFRISSKQSGLIISGYEIGNISTMLFVSFFGNRFSVPRILACSGILSLVAGVISTFPHFVYGAGDSIIVGDTDGVQNFGYGKSQRGLCMTFQNSTEASCSSEVSAGREGYVVWVILVLSQVVLGTAQGPLNTLGVAYIDNSLDPEKSSFLVGLVVSMNTLGPVFGFMLSAVCTRLFITLEATSLTPTDPQWLGAWWLGFLLCSALTVFLIPPFLLFPRMINPKNEAKDTILSQELQVLSDDTRVDQGGVGSQSNFMEEKTADMSQTSAPGDRKDGAEEQEKKVEFTLREFPRIMLRFLKNRFYVLACIGSVLETYRVAGYSVWVPKYIEVQFRLSAASSNIMTGLCLALSATMGITFGGYLVRRLKLDKKGLALLVVASQLCGIIFTFANIFPGCDPVNLAGYDYGNGQFNVSVACSSNCTCGTDEYIPVCVNQTTYFNPCHAGCSLSANGTFFDCSCAPHTYVTSGACEQEPCDMLYVYAVLSSIGTGLSFISITPYVVLLMRVVEEELKAVSLGVNQLAVSILAWAPGPILYGALIDDTCKVWQRKCGQTGHCWIYNMTHYSFYLHGCTCIFYFAAFLCVILLFFLLRRKDRKPN